MMRNAITLVATLALLALILVSPSLAQEPVECETNHTIQAGDWLARIAAKQYGDSSLYPAIVLATNAKAISDANYATITDSWWIEIGWKLCIPTAEAAQSGITVDALENTEYQSEWTKDKTAPLSGGQYSEDIVPGAATKIKVMLNDRMAFGYTSDGKPFAAVILITDPGGSGTFYDLATVVEQDGSLINTTTLNLGDRLQIRSLAVEDGQIVLEAVTHGPNDPMCCPTQLVRNTYAMKDGALVEIESEVLGSTEETSKPATPELVGQTWYWQEYIDNADLHNIMVGDPSKYSLEFLPDGTYQIQADCNKGSGAYIVDSSRVTLQPGPMTLAACGPESLDAEFVTRLGEVVTYVLKDGSLYLNLKMDAGDMVFGSEPVPAPLELQGQTWYWQKYVDNADLHNIVVGDPSKYSLEFLPDGTYQIQADCNRGSGEYIVDGSNLTIKPGPLTRAACGPDSLDTEFLAKLGDVVTYVLKDGMLYLNLKMDAGDMVFDTK